MNTPALPRLQPRRRQGGVALLEALIAAVLLAIGLLGTIGLQARAYSALSDAAMRTEATIAAERLIGVMTSDGGSLGAYAVASGATPGARLAPWHAATRASIPGAQIAVTVTAGVGGAPSEVLIVIGWQRQASAAANAHTVRTYI
jgi:type IV pilus assembly protein PilV